MRCLVILALLPAPTLAQSIGEPIPGRRDPLAVKAKPAPPAQAAARPCPQYGPGFVRLEGSSACVRVGGSVRVDVGTGSRGGIGSSTRGAVELETRSETGLGPVRTVVRAQGLIDRGLESRPYRY